MATDALQDAHVFAPHRSGRYGKSMIEQVAKLQSDVEYIKRDVADLKIDVRELRVDVRDVRDRQERDFRLLFGALITSVLGLATVMAKGFGWF
jgi:hypothetical protein